ncbi:hypothetical protein BOX15_Mlig003695g4 [Macrostomum lignano]|uniref:Uncharacterized protein n=3 Tax=Macrostomum lignano TaxID=282301 RepID=A0A267DR46_9PLAT|nr:hypothetical protein BOX15_Mlig003695g4 [Macrostomum lignano]
MSTDRVQVTYQVTASKSRRSTNERETWGKKIDFLLSVIGFAVDLANVWRFPYLCYKNGGGAFLIPYLLMLVIGGIPLFYMELALGQYVRKGAITCWGRVCPLFKGIGLCVVMIAFFTDFFYNVIIAWSLYFLFASFAVNLPWTSCNNTWNMPTCYDEHLSDKVAVVTANLTTAIQTAVDANSTGRTYPAHEFFYHHVLGNHPDGGYGIGNLGTVQWKLAMCLALVYIICYFSLWKGISMSGKVVWFTALFPYVVLLILLVRGVTLEGSMKGIHYYIKPNMTELLTSRPWIDAATQVFFSLGPGFGVLLAFASYNKFNNNVYKDAMITSAVNCMTSFLSGFVVFAIIGYLAHKRQEDVKDVISDDPGLVFTVYPEALATLPGSTFWSLCFFLMLMTLGLDSSFGGSEAIITGVSDEFTIIRRNRELFVLGLFVFYYSVGLAEVTQGGIYILNMLERFSVQYSILIAVLFETMCVSWIYGVDRFRENIREMTGILPGIYWKLCWKFLAPIFIMFNIAFGLYQHEPLSMGSYKYPLWANVVGWMLAASSVMWIPIVAIVQIIKTPGTLRERIAFLLTPQLSSVQQGNGAAERPKVAATEEEVAEILQELDIKALKEDAV